MIFAVTGIPAARIECAASIKPTRLHDSVVWLTENFRFARNSGIGRLAAHVNAGEAQAAIESLRSGADPALECVLCAEPEGPRGVVEINRFAGRHFRDALDHPLDPGSRSEWYPGRPVMVLRNDYVLTRSWTRHPSRAASGQLERRRRDYAGECARALV